MGHCEPRRPGQEQPPRVPASVSGTRESPDLFYRLNVFRIELPALRERRDDIPMLVNHFVHKFSLQMNKKITRVSPAAMNLLQQQAWSGNVRELENAVERAMMVAQEPEIRESDFVFKATAVPNGAPKSLDEIEKVHILRDPRVGWVEPNASRGDPQHRPGHAASQAETVRLEQALSTNAMKLLQLLSIGDFDGRLLMELAPAMASLFRVPTEILPVHLNPEFAYHGERQQYHSSEILQTMKKYIGPDSWRVLGITSVDLYIPILTFVFGEAQIGGPCGLVSMHRLRQEFYGLPADCDLLQERLLKEAVHEIGHTIDLTHCEDDQCAMAPSHAVEWIDLKDSLLCPSCKARVLVS